MTRQRTAKSLEFYFDEKKTLIQVKSKTWFVNSRSEADFAKQLHSSLWVSA